MRNYGEEMNEESQGNTKVSSYSKSREESEGMRCLSGLSVNAVLRQIHVRALLLLVMF